MLPLFDECLGVKEGAVKCEKDFYNIASSPIRAYQFFDKGFLFM